LTSDRISKNWFSAKFADRFQLKATDALCAWENPKLGSVRKENGSCRVGDAV